MLSDVLWPLVEDVQHTWAAELIHGSSGPIIEHEEDSLQGVEEFQDVLYSTAVLFQLQTWTSGWRTL